MPPQPLAISAVQFGEDAINIQYVELHEQNDTVVMMRSMTIDTDEIPRLMDVLTDTIEEIVDHGLLALRNPPASIPSRKYAPVEGDDDEAGTSTGE